MQAEPDAAARLDRPGRPPRPREALDRARRRRANRDLWRAAAGDRPHRRLPARARPRRQRPGGAPRQQLDRAPRLLFRRDGLRRDHLHRPCRDEPQPARQYLRAPQARRWCCIRTGSGSTTSLPTSPRHACGSGAGTTPERGHVLRRSLRARAERRHTDAGPDDDAVILFTSGTSAQPKGVVLNYREHLGNIDPTADGFGITADDRVYDFRSFNWASAQLLGALVPVNRGATLVMAEKFSASRFFQHVRDHRVTVAAGNPTTINILLNTEGNAHRDNLPSLRFITSSSAPLTIEEWRRFEERFGIPIAQGYGSSETGWIAAIPGEAAAAGHGRAAVRLSRSRDRRRRRTAAAAGRDRRGRDRRLCRPRLPLSRRRRQRADQRPRPSSAPAISACSTPTASCGSPAARRT